MVLSACRNKNKQQRKEIIMNKFTGSGRLTRHAVLNGDEKKALKFTLAARYGYDKENKKDRVEFVPCVMFNPSEKITELLMDNGQGTQVELEGRVATSSFERDGETHYRTEVIVEKHTFKIIAGNEPLPL